MTPILLAAVLALGPAAAPRPSRPAPTDAAARRVKAVLARAAALSLFHNRLAPYVMLHSRSRQLTVLSGVPTEGLHMMGGLPEEPWLLLSFYAVPDARPRRGSDLGPCPDTDMPLLIRFQHQPVSATLTGDGLKLTFRRECGYLWIMPLFGRGQVPLRQTQTWPDNSAAYQAAVEKCRDWSAAMIAPPIDRKPDGTFSRLSIEDDWSTAARPRAPEAPGAERIGDYTAPSVMAAPGDIGAAAVDIDWSTCSWPRLTWPRYRNNRGESVNFGSISPDLLRVPVVRRTVAINAALSVETCAPSLPISSLPGLHALPDRMQEAAALYAPGTIDSVSEEWTIQRNQAWLGVGGAQVSVVDGEVMTPGADGTKLTALVYSPTVRTVRLAAGPSARAWVSARLQAPGRLALSRGANRVTVLPRQADGAMRLEITGLDGLPSPGLRFARPRK